MDPRDPTTPDPTGQNRRQFLQTTGLATAAAAVGVGTTGSAVAIDEEGEFEATPYSLGVASGDPLPNSVVLWTRLAPEPTQPGFGMPDEAIDLEWTVATDEGMNDVVTAGTATAEPADAHTVHVDAGGLEANTEYYYQFEARGATSPVGRTRTAPGPNADVESFEFAFASCQRWVDGYYTPYRGMAEAELDLIVHLGDYLYEYGIGANGGARNTSVPQHYRAETTDLETYRLRYGLYMSDPALQAAHASAPWLVTRDDHEVDNNWADDVPQDPDKQTMEAFLRRRADAFKAYYEHMPFRKEQEPEGPDQKLYRNYSFGDLIEFNVLDTRLYRSDQACGDAFNVDECMERFDEDRTILGDNQKSWLLDNLEDSTATWDVLANQLPFARMDFLQGPEDGYRMEQWDGYVADQNEVKRAFENEVDNPVVITGDFHSNWASEIRSVDNESEPVGVEFVGTSISSNGDGSAFDDFGGDDVLGKHVIRENDNVYYNSNRRGYTHCTVTPSTWTTDYRIVDYVTEPGAPIHTDAVFRVEAGTPGLQTPPTTVSADAVAVNNGKVGSVDLSARWLPDGFAGGKVTLSFADPGVARFTDASAADAFGLSEATVSDDGTAATIRVADVDDEVGPVVAGAEVVSLASVDVRGEGAGTTDVAISVEGMTDDAGNVPGVRTLPGMVIVGPPPVAGGRAPTDPDGDGHYEDVNGNGRLDYDDIQTLFDHFDSDSVRLNEAAYDFNDNGKLEFDDIVTLYREVD